MLFVHFLPHFWFLLHSKNITHINICINMLIFGLTVLFFLLIFAIKIIMYLIYYCWSFFFNLIRLFIAFCLFLFLFLCIHVWMKARSHIISHFWPSHSSMVLHTLNSYIYTLLCAPFYYILFFHSTLSIMNGRNGKKQKRSFFPFVYRFMSIVLCSCCCCCIWMFAHKYLL